MRTSGRLRTTTVPLAVSVVLELVVGAAVFVRSSSVGAPIVGPSVEDAVPGLVERIARSTWSPVAWDDPEAVKEQVRAAEEARIADEVPATWAREVAAEELEMQQLTLARALTVPQPIVVEQRVEVLAIDDVDVDGGQATATVTWASNVRIRPHEPDPRQIGSFVVDADGWRTPTPAPNHDRLELVVEDGEWKVVHQWSLNHGGG